MQQNILTEFVIPASLFLIMVGLGLSLKGTDFWRVLCSRKAVVTGIIGQILLLPMLGYGVVVFFQLDSMFGLGLMVLALSPGGALSNAISHLARADLALSVTLTALASLIAPFTIPLLYAWVAMSLTGESSALALPFLKTILQLILISVIPIGIGMVIRKISPAFAARADKPVRITSLIVFLIVIGGVIHQNWAVFPLGFRDVGLAVVTLNLSSLGLGSLAARLAQLDLKQSLTIGIEVGMQNAATATFVTATLLGNITLAIPSAIYASVMVPSALIFGIGMSRLVLRRAVAPVAGRLE